MDLHRLCVNTIKTLAIDGVEAANSGHPGMPMGMAEAATILWTRFLKFDPANPTWPDRDRFVLSAGHGSMLLYSLLHLSGFKLTIDDLRQFRQWGSKTPGHPEFGHTEGVETTTGPLGQGFAMGVGMALAERFQRETFGSELCDHFTYGIVSDGDLMEGVSQEAASLAGHLKLGRIIYLYDSNRITIDGSTDLSFSEDVAKRFEAYGWQVIAVDGYDPEAIANAISAAKADPRPSLLTCRTTIGQGCRSEGSEKTHGAPLGKEETRWVKQQLGFDPDQTFVVPSGVYDAFRAHSGAKLCADWYKRLESHGRRDEFQSWLNRDGARVIANATWPTFQATDKVATRKASQSALKAMIAVAPWLIGGSADLAGSNGTETGKPIFSRDQFADAQTIAFGVREHGMAAIANGMALHGGVLPYCATFLVFHDYMRPSVRLSCLMNQPVVYIYTHDSIFLGEDGPTHQPIETLLALRALPGMAVIRPADGPETVEAWKAALLRHNGPTALILTRQNLPTLTCQRATGLHRGAYLLREGSDVALIATGSEVSLAMTAAERLAAEGISARVVSMPWREKFLTEDIAYQRSILPSDLPKVAIEAATTLGWDRIVGEAGAVIGIDHFGASAPDRILAEKFGFVPEHILQVVKQVLAR